MVDTPRLTAEAALQRWAPGVASATLALADAEPCGDATLWLPAPEAPGGTGGLLAIVDGLGHGAPAAQAAQAVLQVLRSAPQVHTASLAELLQACDSALAGLRGAAVGLLRVRGTGLQHVGVGNTRAMRWREGRLDRLPSFNGIVGGGLPARLPVTEQTLQPGDWLLLFTDGLDERLSLPVLLPEWQRDPALLCQHLLQRHRQGRDDCGVLVMHVGAD